MHQVYTALGLGQLPRVARVTPPTSHNPLVSSSIFLSSWVRSKAKRLMSRWHVNAAADLVPSCLYSGKFFRYCYRLQATARCQTSEKEVRGNHGWGHTKAFAASRYRDPGHAHRSCKHDASSCRFFRMNQWRRVVKISRLRAAGWSTRSQSDGDSLDAARSATWHDILYLQTYSGLNAKVEQYTSQAHKEIALGSVPSSWITLSCSRYSVRK